MFIFDAHLDLSMNAIEWNRDLRCDLEELRRRESGMTDRKDRGNGVVSFPAMRRGNIGLCVATQIARYVKPDNPRSGWASPEQAWAQTQAQLAWYRAMEEDKQLVQITNTTELKSHLELWKSTPSGSNSHDKLPIGYVLSLEGADSIVTLDHLSRAYEYGLRALGPAHYGPGTYSAGTDSEGGFSNQGRELLKEMDRLGLILDATHLTDPALAEAFDSFTGPIWASHCNCRTLVPHQRQLDDEHIKILIEKQGVIGVVFDAWMMVPQWIKGTSTPQKSNLKTEAIIEHIDHICQLAGTSDHVGIGSDLDGGYGTEQCPTDIDSIEKLQIIAPLLEKRGYSPLDIEKIMSRNWINFLERAL
jgi:membrane dipeptidase